METRPSVVTAFSKRAAKCLARAALLLALTGLTPALSADAPSFLIRLSVTWNDGASGSVAADSGSLNCVGPLCGADSWGYKSGTTVTLTASPASGTTFQGWGGACSGTAPTCAVTLSADTDVSATFAGSQPQQNLLQLNATYPNQGHGTVTSSPAGLTCANCFGATKGFNAGTVVTLTATPGSDSTFQGWGGACSGTGTCTVTMSSNQTVTAAFQAIQRATLNLGVINNGGSGTITSSPAGLTCNAPCNSGAFAFNSGATVTLTATPVSGSAFQGWGGACSGTGTCTVTMNSSQTVTATFVAGSGGGGGGGSSGGSNNSGGNPTTGSPNVVAPVFNSNGNSSFIRIGNAGPATTTVTMTVLGSPSGAVYGTAQYQVPANASPQYALSSILTDARAGALTNGDTGYRLSMEDADPGLSYQHVLFNSSNLFFENVSACHFDSARDYSGLNAVLYNVHTSLLASYPAQIYVDNSAASAATYNVSIYDNNTGVLVGVVPITIPAKSTYTQPFSWFEQQLKWTPSSSQAHANMVFSPVSPATFQIAVSDYIFNEKFSAYVNMSQRCGFNH